MVTDPGSVHHGWATAPTVSWDASEPFDLQEFQEYLRTYMPRTRLRLSQASDPVEMAPSTQWDTYPRHSTSGTRHHAVSQLYFFYILPTLY